MSTAGRMGSYLCIVRESSIVRTRIRGRQCELPQGKPGRLPVGEGGYRLFPMYHEALLTLAVYFPLGERFRGPFYHVLSLPRLGVDVLREVGSNVALRVYAARVEVVLYILRGRTMSAWWGFEGGSHAGLRLGGRVGGGSGEERAEGGGPRVVYP